MRQPDLGSLNITKLQLEHKIRKRRKLLSILNRMRKVEQFQNVDCEEESNEENNEEIMIEEELDENHNIIELKSLENALSIYTLQIFDFDATLFDTPLPEDGCRQYEEKTGRPWPHQGWWGCPESLMDPLEILPGPAYDDFLKHINLPHTHTIVV